MIGKHTPGPWKRSDKADGNWWHIGAGNQAIATAPAASKKRNEPYASMFEANANLIAAAPELLVALEQIKSFAELAMIQANNAGADWEIGSALSSATKAIAKAKGGAA